MACFCRSCCSIAYRITDQTSFSHICPVSLDKSPCKQIFSSINYDTWVIWYLFDTIAYPQVVYMLLSSSHSYAR